MPTETLQQYAAELKTELTTNILPFHLHTLDTTHGGFFGRVDNAGVHTHAEKGLVQHSRLLWTFSQAYRTLGDNAWLRAATHAYQFLTEKLFAGEEAGFHWLVNYAGTPTDSRKFTYGQSFALYGLSEYHRATGDESALARAVALFEWLESTLRDDVDGGYWEGINPNGSRFDESVSVDQTTAAKTMNTHLHMLEAYTNLFRVWNDESLRQALGNLIQLTVERIINAETGHFKLHFSADWQSLNERISYGHDIEGSWLLLEAAEVLGNAQILQAVKPIVLKMAQATLAQGLAPDGSLLEENAIDDRVWWVQAEAMVGFLNAWQLTQNRQYLDASLGCWAYVQAHIIDHEQGEWLSGRRANGSPMPQSKAGMWKTPYHNGRACFEITERVDKILCQIRTF